MIRVIIVCGPTASGKTGYAHRLALKLNGEIVNADAMQIYRQFPIITASPSDDLQKELPYHLYNFLDIDQAFSVMKYANLASDKIKEITKRGKLPIIVGGSGMYINALISGYHNIPDISEDIRNKATKLREEMGAAAFFSKLSQLDSIAGKKLNINDSQRVVRAYNVITETGRSIYSWQEEEKTKLLADYEFE
ncbi:MAG: tRNA (adenosine(37)-N6)-dimethylallyltransferase MiaA, partial [Rickettsiaceae bacterium]|nr:tRNA (adenosine(37)-N6)-dimethylallyltransferase MiaA [Rickettsiaceae bacterium]